MSLLFAKIISSDIPNWRCYVSKNGSTVVEHTSLDQKSWIQISMGAGFSFFFLFLPFFCRGSFCQGPAPNRRWISTSDMKKLGPQGLYKKRKGWKRLRLAPFPIMCVQWSLTMAEIWSRNFEFVEPKRQSSEENIFRLSEEKRRTWFHSWAPNVTLSLSLGLFPPPPRTHIQIFSLTHLYHLLILSFHFSLFVHTHIHTYTLYLILSYPFSLSHNLSLSLTFKHTAFYLCPVCLKHPFSYNLTFSHAHSLSLNHALFYATSLFNGRRHIVLNFTFHAVLLLTERQYLENSINMYNCGDHVDLIRWMWSPQDILIKLFRWIFGEYWTNLMNYSLNSEKNSPSSVIYSPNLVNIHEKRCLIFK